jgi:uncharacterized protein (DUF111 family)
MQFCGKNVDYFLVLLDRVLTAAQRKYSRISTLIRDHKLEGILKAVSYVMYRQLTTAEKQQTCC